MLMEQISELIRVCNEQERKVVEKCILAAGSYVHAVIDMRTKQINYAGRTGEDLRNTVEAADHERTSAHNALITWVDVVNRLCAARQLPSIYTGGSERRQYGDFALALVAEIFAQR